MLDYSFVRSLKTKIYHVPFEFELTSRQFWYFFLPIFLFIYCNLQDSSIVIIMQATNTITRISLSWVRWKMLNQPVTGSAFPCMLSDQEMATSSCQLQTIQIARLTLFTKSVSYIIRIIDNWCLWKLPVGGSSEKIDSLYVSPQTDKVERWHLISSMPQKYW